MEKNLKIKISKEEIITAKFMTSITHLVGLCTEFEEAGRNYTSQAVYHRLSVFKDIFEKDMEVLIKDIELEPFARIEMGGGASIAT